MFANILEMLVYICAALLAVKLVFFRKKAPVAQTEAAKQSVSWKSALDAMSVMEERLAHLQYRDVKNQEKIWKLEDDNSDLKARLARTTQELLLLTKRDTINPMFQDDDDEPDIGSSIPPSS